MDELRRYVNIGSDSTRWQLFGHRPGDVIVSTPPKSGTTLTQRLCSLAIFQSPALPQLLKTHTPLDGIPHWDDVIYLTTARDPRDVFASWEGQLPNMDPEATVAAIETGVGIEQVSEFLVPPLATVAERIEQWLETDDLNAFSLARHLHHMEVSWQRRARPNVFLFHFDDLRGDQTGALATVAEALGSGLTGDQLAELAPAASFAAMKADAANLAPNTKGVFAEPDKFFRSGTSGGWETLLDDAAVGRYWERCRTLASPELIDWVHRDPNP